MQVRTRPIRLGNIREMISRLNHARSCIFTVCKINVIGVLQDPDPDPTNYSKVADFLTPI